ncbi:MAG: formate C-acetyltransferase/glycerol dehydratase family glycyl radical enzyme [Anaerolineae bacterium]|nr:MAG: formate C-acetyltransferase/glycerol dehydratase family glycyl radical enzyme [Anaerolineae bacterium]
MSSHFPYQNPSEATEFALGYFQRLQADPDIRQTWLGLRSLIQVHINAPDIAVYVDTRDGQRMIVTPGVAPESPALTLTLSADTFHRIYAGEMNVFLAFATRKIKTRGNVALIMKTTWTLPQAIRIYRRYGAELGLSDFVTERIEGTAVPIESAAATRVERLLERRLHTRPEVCLERARYYTASMRETEGEPQVIRQAKTLAHVLAHLTVHIESDELIVGAITSKALGAGVYPEGVGSRVLGELETIGFRETNPFTVTDEQLRELRDEILPYWRGKTLEDIARGRLDVSTVEPWSPKVSDAIDQVAPFIATEIAGIGHMLLNYEGILSQGLAWYARRAGKLRKTATDKRSVDFYEAAAIACQGVIHFAERYAAEAERLAAVESDPARCAELRQVAEVCHHVPSQPARTFHEALQAMQFVLVAAQIEDYESAFSIGRLDQLLWPYYRTDLEAGRLTEEEALELLQCFYIKVSGSIPLFDADVSLAFAGMTAFANAVVGGVDAEGRDATNPISYLAVEAMRRANTQQPNFGVRLHRDTPHDFLDAATHAMADGLRNVQFFNDEAIVPALVNRGIPLQEARNYGVIGCVEPAVPGVSFTSSDAALFNLGLCLELALNDGRGRLFTDQLGRPTGDPRRFTCIEEVIQAYRQQVAYLVGLMVQALDVLAKVHAEFKPKPFISATTGDCLARGLDLTWGGGRYDFTGVQGVGAATVGDSLAALDALVFREERLTMDEMLAALDADFEGQEPLRQTLVNRAPKYGNDDKATDRFTRLAAEIYCQEVESYPNPRGGRYQPGLYSVTTHVALGLAVGATPDGRRAGAPLSQGISPAQGRDRHGPTAAMRSAARLNHRLVSNGSAFNQKINPAFLRGGKGPQTLSSLLSGYFQLGGMQLQWNLVDRDTLQAAQEHPEDYRDLIVRVSGYSAHFTDLERVVQDDIIARMEHAV